MKRFRRFLLPLAGIVVVALASWAAVDWRTHQRALELLPVNARMGGDFILPATTGAALDTRALRGRVVLLNFGFASCPDICPTVLARLRQVVKTLGPAGEGVQVVFVSFDPARDTVARLKPYVQHFHPGFIAATGSETQIAQVAARYGVVYLKEDTGSAAGYGFAHSDYIYLIDGAGRVRKLYDTRARTDEIVADIRLLQAADRSLFHRAVPE